MSLEKRLTDHLSDTGESIAVPTGDPSTAARAGIRRRRNRRIGGGSVAALVLVAGGLGVMKLVGDGQSNVSVATESQGDAAGAGSLAEEQIAAAVPADGATTRAFGATELLDDTGPELEWSESGEQLEFHPGELVWTGSEFLALSYSNDAPRLVRTTDGSSWDEAGSLPTGFRAWGLRADGNNLVVWGTDDLPVGVPTENPPSLEHERPDTQILLSTDSGDTWAALGRITSPDDAASGSPYLRSSVSVSSVAVAGDTVVVASMAHTGLDLERILADHGPLGDGDQDEKWLEFGYGFGDGAVFYCADRDCDQEKSISFDDLGLSDEDIARLEGGPEADGTTMLRSTGGGPLVAVDIGVSGGYADALVAVNGEFVLCSMGEGGSTLLHSPDGAAWSVVASGEQMGNLTTDGEALYAQAWSETGGPSWMRSLDGGRNWAPFLEDAPGVHQLSIGPGGFVATGELLPDGFDAPPFVEPVSLDKDGYRITWNFSDDIESLTVIEIESGDTVLSFGPAELGSDDPPGTVIEEEDGESFRLTFLDPETLEPIVSLDEDDMSTAFGRGELSEGEAVTGPPAMIIGWSADGSGWGWQTTEEAFGVNGWAQAVVGDDIVLALVEEFDGGGFGQLVEGGIDDGLSEEEAVERAEGSLEGPRVRVFSAPTK